MAGLLDDQLQSQPSGGLLFPYADNPVGTSTTAPQQSLTMPSPDVSPTVGWYGAHPQTEAGRADAIRLAGNMAQFGPADVGTIGGLASPFEYRPSPGRSLPRDNYLNPLSDHAPVVFREAAPGEAHEILSGQPTAFGRVEKFVADNPDIALGQGVNKGGVQMAFDASKLQGQINRSKPAWDLGYQNGAAEYVGKGTNQSFRSALSGLRIPDTVNLTQGQGRGLNYQLNQLLAKGWTTRAGDGFTEYLPPAD